MTDNLLLRQDQDGVAWLTLNRPAARNALSAPLMTALEAALDAIAADPAIRVTVIAGPARPSAPGTICGRCAGWTRPGWPRCSPSVPA